MYGSLTKSTTVNIDTPARRATADPVSTPPLPNASTSIEYTTRGGAI
jgi:hypothetical protein